MIFIPKISIFEIQSIPKAIFFEIRLAARVLDWKKSMPMSDYLGKAREYVTQQFESAVQIRKILGVERQRSFGLSR